VVVAVAVFSCGKIENNSIGVMVQLVDHKPYREYEQKHAGNNERRPQNAPFGFFTRADEAHAFLLASDADNDEQDAAQSSYNFVYKTMHSIGVLKNT
jgi:hypothetical protein